MTTTHWIWTKDGTLLSTDSVIEIKRGPDGETNNTKYWVFASLASGTVPLMRGCADDAAGVAIIGKIVTLLCAGAPVIDMRDWQP